MYVCNCEKKQFDALKPMQLNVNNKLLTLPKEAWMSYDEERKENQKCKILMHPYDISMTATYKWVIGLQFLQNFYSIFDIENKRVGLIEAVESI